ncbi:hypothetical protein [Amantichitinum ursilacus]|uniref:Uncharacterized protein n=1 Tax=Amantichitinum ursilacus TaxID=857265 RepID=A0A0N0XFI3_9NEIS|nr:hypothetical protein [Amantichitinum ursilacus]KPC49088.1 hypothetical protein WG78_21250 [Amantichitinum ursilacus]
MATSTPNNNTDFSLDRDTQRDLSTRNSGLGDWASEENGDTAEITERTSLDDALNQLDVEALPDEDDTLQVDDAPLGDDPVSPAIRRMEENSGADESEEARSEREEYEVEFATGVQNPDDATDTKLA